MSDARPPDYADVDGERARSWEEWVNVIDDVIDESVRHDDAIELTAEDLAVEVPTRFGEDAPRAEWRFDGSVTVSVKGASGPLAEWLRWWYERR